MSRLLPLLLPVGLLVGCVALRSPPSGASPTPAPPALGTEPVVAEIEPGARHRYLLDVAPGHWATIELVQREVALDLRVLDAAGSPIAGTRSPSSWSTAAVDLVVGEAGRLEVEIASPARASRAAGYRLRLAAERPARPDDAARLAARRRLREIEAPPPDAPAPSPAESEAFLRGLLASRDVEWSAAEEAWIRELCGSQILAQGRPEEAAEMFRAGIDRLAGAAAGPVAAYLRLGLAQALAKLGEIEESRREYRSAVESAAASGDREAFGLAVNLEAGFLQANEEAKRAIARLEEVVTTLDPPQRVNAHLNLALALRAAGDLQAALDHYEEAERLTREAAVGRASSRLVVLRTGGILYRTAGDVEQAREALSQARRLALDEERTDWEASIGTHLGALLVQLGEYAEARRLLERSADLAERAADADQHVSALASLGWVELAEGDAAAAAALLGRALGLADAREDLRSSLLYALAVAKTRLGAHAEARPILEQLVARAEAKGLEVFAAESYYALGSLHLEDGALDEAAAALGRAARLAEAVGDPLRLAAVSSRLAELEMAHGRLAQALVHVRSAIGLQEEARSQLADPDLRATFLARWRSDYDRAIEISMSLAASEPGAGHERLAFELSEAAHARTLTELLTEARVEVRRGISPELLAAEGEADRRLTRAQSELRDVLERAAPDSQVERLREEWERARWHRDEVEREIRRSHPRYAEIRYPRPPGVEQVQAWLPPSTALLEYALGERSSALFVVTGEELAAFPLPSGEEIAARVADVRRLFVNPSPLTRPQLASVLAELTELLVAPAAGHLAKVEHLLVVPDGDLFLLPFEALADPTSPQSGPGGMLSRWAVSYLPAAAVLPHLERQSPATWQRDLLAFADPPPVRAPPAGALRGGSRSALLPAEGLSPLPAARREANRIAQFFPPDRVEVHVGEAARESLLKSPPPNGPARRLHIASHGVIGESIHEEPYVLLAADDSDDGRLHLREVFNLDLAAELVVLSGCETALGPRLEGEGLLGLARGFLYAGARDLVVSLWPVSDAGTEELMVDFYRLLAAGRPPAEALREAKLAHREEHPFLWAPFVTFGAPVPEAR